MIGQAPVPLSRTIRRTLSRALHPLDRGDGSQDSWGYDSAEDEFHWDDSQNTNRPKKLAMNRNVGPLSAAKTSDAAVKGLLVAVDGEWYELDDFASKHPGGTRILTKYHQMDATDAFYSLHSKKAIKWLKSMQPVEAKLPPPEPSKLDLEYRRFHDKLRADGWFERTLFGELCYIVPIIALFVYGTIISYTQPIFASVLLGLAMQQSGWLAHDMIHARNSTWNNFMGLYFTGWSAGFYRWFWSRKHNTHHVFTNHKGTDTDIDLIPIFWQWQPTPEEDRPHRAWQHLYHIPLYFSLFVSWRIQSLTFMITRGQYTRMLTVLLPNYLWLACLPLSVAAGSVLLSGFFVATVVTLSHETEEMVDQGEFKSFVAAQLDGTKDIVTRDPFTEWFCGGMQYQVIHHLFPQMPRYYYSSVAPLIEEWAAATPGINYKKESLTEAITSHYQHLREMALVKTLEEKAE